MRGAPDLSQIADHDWEIARRRLGTIRRLAETRNKTRARVAAAAKEIGCGVTQTYELLARYLASPRLTSLLPSRRGRQQGRSMLLAEVDQIIEVATDEIYLTRQKPKIMDMVREIRRRCRTAGLRPPSRGAIVRVGCSLVRLRK
jgi:putative transposase